MWVLPVGAITGPPYAIFDIKPSLGPLTGKTKVTIIGAGFKEMYGPINVRFTGGKGSVDVTGICKS
jgi:dynein heavy chain